MMPKHETGTDELGIRYEGPVLSGLLGLRQQLERQAASSPQAGARIREIAPGGIAYAGPPSPVHCSHGNPVQPDPLYACQREQLGHPSLADPVIRHHLNLPPLPDPYEERRLAEEYWAEKRLKHIR
jgi:hypothetical protein